MTNVGRWLIGAFVLFAGLALPSAVGSESVCAAEGDRAALVVDTGGSVHTFCVVLPEGETSGLDLIALANEQHDLAYKLGFGGEAVCMLAGVGPTSDDCFEQYPNFWGYWRGDGRGGWIWSGTGAGSTSVTDGDVEGWSWGSGSNGDSHPRPPATTFGDVCAGEAEEPSPTQSRRPRDGDDAGPRALGADDARRPRRPAPGPTAAVSGRRPVHTRAAKGPTKDAKGPREKEREKPRRGRSDDPATVAGRVAPSPTRLDETSTAALEPTDPSGPPATGLAALGAAALLGGAGFAIARRRSAGSPR